MVLPIALALGGAAIAAYGMMGASKAKKKAAAASQAQENLRRQQMQMEGERAQRRLIRQAYMAQAEGLTRATGQTGSSALGGSSAVPGAVGQIRGQEREGTGYISAQLAIGHGIFDQKAIEAKANAQAATFQGIQSLGMNIMGSSQQAAQVIGGIPGLFGPGSQGANPFNSFNTEFGGTEFGPQGVP